MTEKKRGFKEFERFTEKFGEFVFSRLGRNDFTFEDGFIINHQRTISIFPRQSKTNDYEIEDNDPFCFKLDLIQEATNIFEKLEDIPLSEIELLTPQGHGPIILTGNYFEIHLAPRVEIGANKEDKEDKEEF
jgi:hypothetical protein